MTGLRERPRVAIVGAGPAGLMAAEVVARRGAAVTIYDRMLSPGRKMLLAGRGGLNLTHSESKAAFHARYGAAADALAPALEAFGPTALRDWCAELGIETFVGTSGRVFPRSFKTSPLLRAWLRRLDAAGVAFRLRHHWRGWEGVLLAFDTPEGRIAVEAEAVVIACGGASWPQLGSDGGWIDALAATGAEVNPLKPANCGFVVPWSDLFRDRFEGQPLKNVALSFAGEVARGDAIVTRAGIEGGLVYALAPLMRGAIERDGDAIASLALRPDLSHESLVSRLDKRQIKQSLSTSLRKTLGLSPVAIGLLREARPGDTLGAMDSDSLARLVNAVPLRITAPMPIARAISTAGGVAFGALDGGLMLTAKPGVFVAGEMLDWEAPTGGYLLQACFATGAKAGQGAAGWVARDTADRS